ncbi:MAG: class I adenylate-forming enzyme family protein [Myxococcales bacterium]|nr:class I adenylate-forming enzyme family protein [Myxococcales bacterium]
MGMSIQEATELLTAHGGRHEIIEREVRGQRLRCWRNIPDTLRELALQIRCWDDRVYLVYEDERLTYAEVFARVATLATRLVEDLGVEKGDRVAIAMRNFPEWVIAFWATTSVGAIAVPLNGWWKGEELAYGLLDSGTRVLLCDAERAERIVPHLPELPALDTARVVIARGDGAELPPGARRFEDVLGEIAREPALPDVAIEPDDLATIFYTSGTTGNPKGALGTHRNMVTNVGSAGFVRARAALRKGLELPEPGAVVPQTATLVSVPLFHVTGSHSMLAYNTFTGGKLVMMYRWNPERALELIEREGITNFGGVPAMVWQVLESPDFERRDTSSVLGVGYGGAPAAPELVRRIKAVFPESSPSNGYGLTETSAIATSNAGVDYERKPDSVGLAMPICDVKVVGEDGTAQPVGSVGELHIRGPNVVVGYWNKPEASEKTFGDGFLHSGDVVRMDEEGFIYILDRAKDMLIRGGENIYCVEVENVLYAHPEVMDAAVIGLPHRTLGEEVGAIVQVVAGSSVDEAALQAHAAQHLASFKVPIRIDTRTEPLPRNANGKILKRQLKGELGLA